MNHPNQPFHPDALKKISAIYISRKINLAVCIFIVIKAFFLIFLYSIKKLRCYTN